MFKGLWGSRWRRTERDPLGAALGSLERQVMDIVWDGTSFTVRDVHAKLTRPVAYTTVMTTLDRLFKKGFVARTREGRAFVYTAARTRAEVEAAMASGVLGGLLSQGNAMPILSNLVDETSSPSRVVEDHHVDRPGVEVQQCMQLTGTNNSIGLIALIKQCSS